MNRSPTSSERTAFNLVRLWNAALLAVIGFVLSMSVSCFAQTPASTGGAAIRGTVTDEAGKPVAGATVDADESGQPQHLTGITDSSGRFEFISVEAGRYTLTATGAGERTAPPTVVTCSAGEQMQLALTLKKPVSTHGPTAANADAMEFADSPSFTIAGVTDWTAVGGHGSDATLRTSEDLARETAALKAQAKDDLSKNSRGDAHRLAGDSAERRGDPLTAVKEYQDAVQADPSEANYFAWGSELLLHRAVLQAAEVFRKGASTYPASSRMLAALGTALFASDLYDEAAKNLCAASDLAPTDTEPYLFMGRVEIASPSPLPCVAQKLARFVQQQPSNAVSNYLYAMALLKQQKTHDDVASAKAEELLSKAVTLDPKCSDAFLQLGILSTTKRDYKQAADFYAKAITADPSSGEAHYRLGVAYDRMGEAEKAKAEFSAHEEIEKRKAAEVEKQRQEIKQFRVELQDPATATEH